MTEEYKFDTHELDIPPADMHYLIDTAKTELKDLKKEYEAKLKKAEKKLRSYERGSFYSTSRRRAGIYL